MQQQHNTDLNCTKIAANAPVREPTRQLAAWMQPRGSATCLKCASSLILLVLLLAAEENYESDHSNRSFLYAAE